MRNFLWSLALALGLMAFPCLAFGQVTAAINGQTGQTLTGVDASGAAAAAQAAAIAASDTAGAAAAVQTLFTNTQTAGVGGVTVNTFVSKDTSSPSKFIIAPTGSCGEGVALSTAASGSTFRLSDTVGTVQVLSDGAITAGDLIVASTTTAGYAHDSTFTTSLSISEKTPVCGTAMTSTTGSGQLVTINPRSRGSYGHLIDNIQGTLLSSLATGIMKVTTGTGAVGVAAAGTDYVIPSGNITGTAAGLSGTQTANFVYASPNGTTGTGLWRSLVAADIPTLNQNTTGTAAGLSGTPTLPSGTTATTQTAGDTTTDLATDAFATAVGTAASTALTNATTQTALTKVIVPPVSGATMELALDGNSSTTYTDQSGNSNNGTLCTGSNAPTNYPGQGVGFNDTGTTFTNYNCITTPVQDWGTFVLAKCTPLMSNSTGTTVGNQYNSYPTPWGTSLSSTGVQLLTFPFNATGVFGQGTMNGMNIFGDAAGATQTAGTQGFAGCHRYIYTLGTSGTSVDHLYVDGVEVTSYLLEGASRALATTTSGGYDLGVGKLTGTFADRGLYTYAMTYSTALTASQVAQTDQYIVSKLAQRPALQSRLNPRPSTTRASQLITVGDSLTASFEGSSQWSTLLSLNNTYTVTNLGIGGFLVDEMCQYFEQRVLPVIVPGKTTILLWGGTNDINGSTNTGQRTVADVMTSYGCIVNKAHKYGTRIVIATMISRTGTSTLYSTNDAAHVLLNTQIRNNWQRMGFDNIADLAEPALLGANGAYATGPPFYTDGIHLTNTAATGLQINTATNIGGYNAVAAMMSNAVNSLDGSSSSSWDTCTSTLCTIDGLSGTQNAAVLTAANNNVVITPTAAGTASLPDCQGRGVPVAITNGSATYSITVSGILSQTITGSATVGTNVPAVFQPLPTGGAATTTGGCYWLRTQ